VALALEQGVVVTATSKGLEAKGSTQRVESKRVEGASTYIAALSLCVQPRRRLRFRRTAEAAPPPPYRLDHPQLCGEGRSSRGVHDKHGNVGLNGAFRDINHTASDLWDCRIAGLWDCGGFGLRVGVPEMIHDT
jgi:hypothetical protein